MEKIRKRRFLYIVFNIFDKYLLSYFITSNIMLNYKPYTSENKTDQTP